MPTHYDALGLDRSASPEDVKAAYRKLAREVHPDVSDAADAKEAFQTIQRAYEILSDPRRRVAYDAILFGQPEQPAQNGVRDAAEVARRRAEKERREAEELRIRAEERMRDAPPPADIDHAATEQLKHLMAVGKLAEAEKLALGMLAREGRQPVPFAVLGDIARTRGDRDKALQYYGLAAQYEPRNPVYQRRYEETLGGHAAAPVKGTTYAPEIRIQPLAVGFFLVVVMAVYTVFARERPLGIPFANQWTFGTMTMLLIAGLSTGVCLFLADALDSFEFATGSAVARLSPAKLIGIVAFFSFWLACAAYFVVGQTQQAFNRSMSAFLAGVVGTTVAFGLAGLSRGPDHALQNLWWGANLVYIGALVGWVVTDSLGRSSRI